MSSLVSVIIPVFNSGKYLKESINSILNQTFDNLELIIVNDGSTDNSWDILRTEYILNEKIKLYSTKNQGQSAACNFGFTHSSGDYIKFFDSDDILNPMFIENQIGLIQGRDDIIASASWGRFYQDDIGTFKLNRESVWRDMQPLDWIVEALENGTNMMQCGLWLIPRKILAKSGLWDENLTLNNDFDFFVRVLLAASSIKYSKGSILYYRSGLCKSLSQRTTSEALISGVRSNLLATDSILIVDNSERTRKACGKNLQFWLFQSYYSNRILGITIQKKIGELQLGRIIYGARPLTRIFSFLFGWRLILGIKYFLKKSP